MESPSSVDFSDENTLGTLWAQLVLKLFRYFLHGMKMCMWFGYNPLIIFFVTFSAL